MKTVIFFFFCISFVCWFFLSFIFLFDSKFCCIFRPKYAVWNLVLPERIQTFTQK